jgi:hypothetical protein
LEDELLLFCYVLHMYIGLWIRYTMYTYIYIQNIFECKLFFYKVHRQSI